MRILRRKEAAGVLGICTRQLDILIRTGALKAVQLGIRGRGIAESEIAAFIERGGARKAPKAGPRR